MQSHSSCQLPLGLQLDDEATFKNFHISPLNAQVLQFLATAVTGPKPRVVFLWGRPGSGRTHLAQALCHQAEELGLSGIFIPVGEHAELRPDILQDLESLDLVCLDDVHAVAGDREWEQALFRLFNAGQESHLLLVMTATLPPLQLQTCLPDLRSRLQSAVVFQLHDADDSGKRALLQLRAESRGFTLDEAVLNYLLLRSERSVNALMEVLNRLDIISVQEQRPITVPLVRQAMGW